MISLILSVLLVYVRPTQGWSPFIWLEAWVGRRFLKWRAKSVATPHTWHQDTMPHTADPEIDRSRDARQKRYERHVTAVDHVEDDAFQDKWRQVRDGRSDVQQKINTVNKEKAPIMVRVRELKKAKD